MKAIRKIDETVFPNEEKTRKKKGFQRKKEAAELTKQEEFVKKHRRHHHEIASWRTILFVLFLVLWEISADFKWIDSFFFSSPSRVARCFAEQLQNNSMLSHIGVTLFETLFSFLLVLLFSLLVSTLLWYSPKLSEILEPYLVVLNSLPKSALAPLFIVWLGTGSRTIIVAGMSVAIFGSIISFYTGFQQVDPEKITLIYTLGGSRRDAFSKVVLPGSIPILLSTAKVNIGLALVGVIIGEFLAARRGLGYLIIYGSQVFQLDMVITSIIVLCIIALGFYKSIQIIEHQIKIRFKM
ncbi:MAG: ABC transporter permease [Lachnospiraceae bacterium]|jgi:NitT/TauT family transport system permease protein|nr:ABC transporter permease [Lachnospiraceae bacterium]